jgi:hypothetical protein
MQLSVNETPNEENISNFMNDVTMAFKAMRVREQAYIKVLNQCYDYIQDTKVNDKKFPLLADIGNITKNSSS